MVRKNSRSSFPSAVTGSRSACVTATARSGARHDSGIEPGRLGAVHPVDNRTEAAGDAPVRRRPPDRSAVPDRFPPAWNPTGACPRQNRSLLQCSSNANDCMPLRHLVRREAILCPTGHSSFTAWRSSRGRHRCETLDGALGVKLPAAFPQTIDDPTKLLIRGPS